MVLMEKKKKKVQHVSHIIMFIRQPTDNRVLKICIPGCDRRLSAPEKLKSIIVVLLVMYVFKWHISRVCTEVSPSSNVALCLLIIICDHSADSHSGCSTSFHIALGFYLELGVNAVCFVCFIDLIFFGSVLVCEALWSAHVFIIFDSTYIKQAKWTTSVSPFIPDVSKHLLLCECTHPMKMPLLQSLTFLLIDVIF